MNPKSAGLFFGRHFSLFDPILCLGQTERRRGVVANLRGGDPSPEANFLSRERVSVCLSCRGLLGTKRGEF